jgi:nicotinate-nucleotide pyrophosphorylase (carboxylating)
MMLQEIEKIIGQALDEDQGDGDVTTLCIVPADGNQTGRFIAKQPGVIAGLQAVELTFDQLDQRVKFDAHTADGDWVEAGFVIAEISGPGRALLTGERVALNLLQRISGVATLTRQFVEKVKGTRAVILDTRKTAPGLRVLDKWGVRAGGGQNHRFGLFDMALIKENHIAAAGGSITEAVMRIRANDTRKRPIEIEVRNLDELRETLGLAVDRILLDNMTLDAMREAVAITGGRIPLEASGNITLANVADVAATGVDYISIGALTHSVQALDISLMLDLPERN